MHSGLELVPVFGLGIGIGIGIGIRIGTGTGLYYFLSYWRLRFFGHRIWVIWTTELLVFWSFFFSAVRRQLGMEWYGIWDHSLRVKKEAAVTEPLIRNCLLVLKLLYLFL